MTEEINIDENGIIQPPFPEHHCNNLPSYVDVFLDIYKKRWMRIDKKNYSCLYIQFCEFCGKKLRINFYKKVRTRGQNFDT